MVNIKDIVDAVDEPYDLFLFYVDRETGKVHAFSRELLSFIEDGGQEDDHGVRGKRRRATAGRSAGSRRLQKFKDAVYLLSIEKDWFRFRKQARCGTSRSSGAKRTASTTRIN